MNDISNKGSRLPVVCLALFGMLAVGSNALAQRPVPGNQPPSPGQKPYTLTIRVADNLVTAEIMDCPLQTTLQELADRTGIVFEVRSQENPQVSVHLARVSLTEAIQRIAVNDNTQFYYSQDKPDRERIAMVRVFPRAAPTQQPGIVYLGSGAITKTNDDVDTPDQAVKALTGNANLAMREKAVELLVRAKNAESVKALTDAMFDPAPEVRSAIIEGLAAIGAREALPGILKSLKDEQPKVRQSAVTAVALLGDAQNLSDIKPLGKDKDPGVAGAVEIAIKKLSAGGKK